MEGLISEEDIKSIVTSPYSNIELSGEEIQQAFKDLRYSKFRKTMESPNFDILSSVDDIELTDEEKDIAIDSAKRHKYCAIKTEAYWKRVKAPKVYPKYSAVELNRLTTQRILKDIPGFVFDKFNMPQLNILSLYFSGEKRFESIDPTYSFKKGLMVFGPLGCGKTTFMEYFQNNQVRSYRMFSCHKISREFAVEGFKMINRYIEVIGSFENVFGHKMYGSCFDDLGTDEIRNNYSNKANIMSEIFLDRYSNMSKNMTHTTANLTVDQIIEIYGERIWSRMREMFNIILFDPNSPDTRK